MILILGASGGLGGGLISYLDSHPELTATYGKRVVTTREELDIEDEASIQSFCHSLEQKLEPKEAIYLINAIGVSLNSFCHKMSLELFEKTIKVNLTGSFLLLKHLQPLLKEHPGSSVVFLSSVVGELGVPGTMAYSASKSALRGLIRTGAKEFARLKVTLNVIELGYFEKGMIEQIPADQIEGILAQIPLSRLGTIEDLFKACDFALRNTFLTGSVIKLNGGMI